MKWCARKVKCRRSAAAGSPSKVIRARCHWCTAITPGTTGKVAAPRVWEASDRAHQIVISPHGVVRGAFANKAAVSKKNIDGRSMTVITFSDNKQKVIAYANDQNAIETVESWYGHPVAGDMKVVTHYGPYRDFAGVKFPSKIVQYQEGNVTLDLTVTAVRANPPLAVEVPRRRPHQPGRR